jgi:hypothetical protein
MVPDIWLSCPIAEFSCNRKNAKAAEFKCGNKIHHTVDHVTDLEASNEGQYIITRPTFRWLRIVLLGQCIQRWSLILDVIAIASFRYCEHLLWTFVQFAWMCICLGARRAARFRSIVGRCPCHNFPALCDSLPGFWVDVQCAPVELQIIS